MDTVETLSAAAERTWLDGWTAGPVEAEGTGLAQGARAPDVVLPDESCAPRRLSEFWAEGPALLMFWRHFGCNCGSERARRLVAEYDGYRAVGLSPVIIGQGDPTRAAVYRERHQLPCPVLTDSDLSVYRAYGLGQWSVERVLYDAPEAFLRHERELGAQFQAHRRTTGNPPVDDPWRAVGEFVVGTDGLVGLPYVYPYCEAFPEPGVLVAAARLSRPVTETGLYATS
jgi:peroxiredoxin